LLARICLLLDLLLSLLRIAVELLTVELLRGIPASPKAEASLAKNRIQNSLAKSWSLNRQDQCAKDYSYSYHFDPPNGLADEPGK